MLRWAGDSVHRQDWSNAGSATSPLPILGNRGRPWRVEWWELTQHDPSPRAYCPGRSSATRPTERSSPKLTLAQPLTRGITVCWERYVGRGMLGRRNRLRFDHPECRSSCIGESNGLGMMSDGSVSNASPDRTTRPRQLAAGLLPVYCRLTEACALENGQYPDRSGLSSLILLGFQFPQQQWMT